MTSRMTSIALGVLILSGLCSCSGKQSGRDDAFADTFVADTLTHHAKYLTIADVGAGVVRVDIADPWNEGRYLGRYALIDRDSLVPDNLGEDIKVIRTPIRNAAVFSAVHSGGLCELDAIECISAVADGAFFAADDTIASLLNDGNIIDVGQASAPSAEKIAAARCEIVLRSPMQGVAAGNLPRGIIARECADYLETSPIARAEWLLLLGELTDKREKAREIFTEVIDTYSDLAFRAAGASSPKPKVLTESEYSGVWYVPAGQSYMAKMLADAGADYPWADTDGSGSLALSLEKVAEKAIDADIWLLRTFGYTASPATLVAQNRRYGSFKALRENNIYGCDTQRKPIFNDIAFHPERVLADYVAIFHPELMPDYSLRYFSNAE